ncbi:MAG: fumarate hydratase [Pseudomonadota bacterium]|jgi:fumarate hydratase class II
MSSDPPTRTERDSLGEVQVPADSLWGAQTQRSLTYFAIGAQRFPTDFIHDFVLVKKAAAIANHKLGLLDAGLAELICQACDELLAGRHDGQFPLSVWQTGSGTQTNMNVNEVIANLANGKAGRPPGSKAPVHPNDHVNLSQSSNDVFPTVMHVCANRLVQLKLLPALKQLCETLSEKATEFAATIKTGRTHMMDATPVTLGQEFGAWRAQLDHARRQLKTALPAVQELAIGGTAVGTGLNTHPRWANGVTDQISVLSGQPFTSAPDKFSQLAAHDGLLALHNGLNLLATVLYKMASDIRLMNSGPRCGLGEIRIPENEPGSSIMPGKVNPTQAEALTMVCVRVMANNTAVTLANSQGQFQLNVYKPLIIICVMESLELLSDAMTSFDRHCLQGITANQAQLAATLQRSLMLVTALTPLIGYDQAARAARHAQQHDLSLREAVLALGLLDEATFDQHINPENMLGPDA